MSQDRLQSQHNGAYYDLPEGCKTLQDIIYAKDMQWNLANILKAAYRGADKGVSTDPIENLIYNLEKARWFADDMLKRIYSDLESNPRGCRDEQE